MKHLSQGSHPRVKAIEVNFRTPLISLVVAAATGLLLSIDVPKPLNANASEIEISTALLESGSRSQEIKENHPEWLKSLRGVYYGKLESAGSTVDVETTFNFVGSVPFTGSYLYAESGELVRGSLQKCSPLPERKLDCEWNDKQGKGSLNIQFSETLGSFEGVWTGEKWNMFESSEGYLWEGKK